MTAVTTRNTNLVRLAFLAACVTVLPAVSPITSLRAQPLEGTGGSGCGVVRGHLRSTLVDTNCDSPTFCAEGRFSGRLNGPFTQKGTGNAPAAVALADSSIPPSLFFAAADIWLETRLCDGVLHLKDTFVVSFAPPDPDSPGQFPYASVQTVIPETSTGGCFGATGQLRLLGTSTAEGADADYEGVFCNKCFKTCLFCCLVIKR